MILCVALNPALDVTATLTGPVEWGATNRVTPVFRPGGKAINVARVLRALGRDTRVLALLGGPTGSLVADRAAALGVAMNVVGVDGDTRRTTTIVETNPDQATVFSEPGPTVDDADWDRFTTEFHRLVSSADAVVCSGSLPPGVPDDAYAALIALAGHAGVATYLDSSGRALGPAIDAGPTLVMPNRNEARELVGWDDDGPWSIDDLAATLVERGASGAVVTDGVHGMVGCLDGALWHATAPVRPGNPTGAGDAALAGYIDATLGGEGRQACLGRAVACASAALASPVAGELGCDPDAIDGVRVERIR